MSSAPTHEFVEAINAITDGVVKGSPKGDRRRYLALTQVERDLFDVNCFNFECICGGLGVYFTNSAGDHWRETIDALDRMGARGAHRILVEACALFPEGKPPSDPDRFWEQANDSALQARLETLGRGVDDQELYEAMEAYWRAHSVAKPRVRRTAKKKSRAKRTG